MKSKIYLFEFYENTGYEYHAEYSEYIAETKQEALANLKDDFPHSRILNTYIKTTNARTTCTN
jgi:hypothetical protein